jgi:hypothetical protein
MTGQLEAWLAGRSRSGSTWNDRAQKGFSEARCQTPRHRLSSAPVVPGAHPFHVERPGPEELLGDKVSDTSSSPAIAQLKGAQYRRPNAALPFLGDSWQRSSSAAGGMRFRLPYERAGAQTLVRCRRDLQHVPEPAARCAVGDLGKTTCQRLPRMLSGACTRCLRPRLWRNQRFPGCCWREPARSGSP